MTVGAETLKNPIEAELICVSDPRIDLHVRTFLIEPFGVMCDWDYGSPDQKYICWMVLKDSVTGAEIGYCEEGFGPKCPWGLVSSKDR